MLVPDVQSNPFTVFTQWQNEAKQVGDYLDGAMALATSSLNLQPSLRMVLLKDFSPEGFIFFSHYTGRKGQELSQNPKAALLFYWPHLDRQVRVEGVVEKISRAETQRYFQSRQRVSQLGAWASPQSQNIASRQELLDKVEHFKNKFSHQTIPSPPHWGGFRLLPQRIEFWVNQANRLHDRFVFERSADQSAWKFSRLAP